MGKDWCRRQNGLLLLDCYLKPRARHDGVLGLHDGRLHLQVQAPPVDGKANAALCAMLAKAFGVSPSQCELRAGAHGRHKTVAIHNPACEPDWFRQLQTT